MPKLPTLTPITLNAPSYPADPKLTRFQTERANLGLPYTGAQPACVYVYVNVGGFEDSEVISMRDMSILQMAVSVPPQYDTRAPLFLIAVTDEFSARADAALKDRTQTHCANCMIIPAINNDGLAINHSTITYRTLLQVPKRTALTDVNLMTGSPANKKLGNH